MNLQQFRELYGPQKTLEVLIKAGSNKAYGYQLLRGDRRPSVKLAKALVQASDHKLDFVSLLAVEKTSERQTA